jgi:hypothetical protein
MVNHICEPISSNQFASCSSARVEQGGGGAPLTQLIASDDARALLVMACSANGYLDKVGGVQVNAVISSLRRIGSILRPRLARS